MTAAIHPVSITAADVRAWTDPEERAERIYQKTYDDTLVAAERRIREQIASVLRVGAGSVELLDEVGVPHSFDAADLFDAIAGHHHPDTLGILLGVLVLDDRDARVARQNANVLTRDFDAFVQSRARYAAENAATLALIEDHFYVD